jgi:hypothetical protein
MKNMYEVWHESNKGEVEQAIELLTIGITKVARYEKNIVNQEAVIMVAVRTSLERLYKSMEGQKEKMQ